jgi:hypothetical protein
MARLSVQKITLGVVTVLAILGRLPAAGAQSIVPRTYGVGTSAACILDDGGGRRFSFDLGLRGSLTTVAGPTRAQFALLLPLSWSGINTFTLDADSNPLIFNGTPITWVQSAAVSAKAAGLLSPPTPSLQWVGFETDEFTPDPSVDLLEFTQVLTVAFAPEGELDGALRFFLGDSTGVNDRLRKVPSDCPMSFMIGDINGDGIIDAADVALIFNARGTPAGPRDFRDIDVDGFITANDARIVAVQSTFDVCKPTRVSTGFQTRVNSCTAAPAASATCKPSNLNGAGGVIVHCLAAGTVTLTINFDGTTTTHTITCK